MNKNSIFNFLFFPTMAIILYLFALYKMGIRAPFERYEYLEIIIPVISGASASIFILLISIIMLAIQLNGRFASLTAKYFFDKKFTTYLLLLLFNVFFPILILPFSYTILVHAVFIYSFVIILLLIPIFSIARDRLKINFIIDSIKKEIDKECIPQEDLEETFNLMNDLKNIIIYLCKTNNYNLIKKSLSTYGTLVEKILKTCDNISMNN